MSALTTPAGIRLTADQVSRIEGDAAELELIFHSIRTLAEQAAAETDLERRGAFTLAVSKMSLMGIGLAGSLARQVGRKPFGMCSQELREISGS